MKHLDTLKPYIVNAFYTWAMDVNRTPLIEVVKYHKNNLPKELKQDETIILNIHPDATINMILSKESMQFEAVFAETNFNVIVFYESIKKIFCKEDNYGLEFEIDYSKISNEETNKNKSKNHLYFIKNN